MSLQSVGFMGCSLEFKELNRKIFNLMTISLRTKQTLNEITKDDLCADGYTGQHYNLNLISIT